MEICVSHYNENLEWLKAFDGPVVVIDHDGAEPHPFETYVTVPNSGYEASAYLKYIIERYDSLPDHVAFIHGHEEADHQLGGRHMLDMIKTANIDKYGYVPLNNAWRFILSEMQLGQFKDRWKQLFAAPMPERFTLDTAAQFVVSKERILANKKCKYEFLYDNIDTKDDATIVEHMWHYIFGEKISMEPKSDLFVPALESIKTCNYQLRPDEVRIAITSSDDFFKDLKMPARMIHMKDSETFKTCKNDGFVFMRVITEKPHELEEKGSTNTVFNIAEAHSLYRVMKRESDLKQMTLLKI